MKKYIIYSLFFISSISIFSSCQPDEPADRLGRSEAVEEEIKEPAAERYHIRNKIVKVNKGLNTAVMIFYVYLDEGLSIEGIKNCLEAMDRYNNLDLMFRMNRTMNRNKAHIKIILEEAKEINNAYAVTLYPQRGMPGRVMKLNKSLYGGTVAELPLNMVTVITHELGHAFGFVHMDYKDNKVSCSSRKYNENHKVPIKPVFGTATSEPITNSFMLACMSEDEERPLLLLDSIGIYNVYGRYRNKGLPFLRYKGKNGYSNYYTTDYNELMEGNDNYVPDGIMGRVFIDNTKDNSLIAMAYYFNSKTKDHYYTNVLSELGMGKDDYEFIRLYYLYPDADGKTRLPLIRFFNEESQQHFYTSDATEAVKMQKDRFWQYEGTVGYLNLN
jgi:hypothetical protein